MDRKGLLALAGAVAGLAAGVVAERAVVKRKRASDPEAGQAFGTRRGERSQTIELADGARIFIEEVGPEAPRGAVFIHGSVLRTDLWHYQMEGLGDHRLVFCDLRGHGLSQPKGSASYRMATLADDLAAVIDASGLEEVVLVGHSVGGMIALELAAAHPEWLGGRIRGLVLVNTTHGPVTETLLGSTVVARIERVTRRPFDALGSQASRIDRLRQIVRPSDALFWAVALASFGPKASAGQIDFVYDMLADTPSDVIFDLIRAYRDYDMTDRLGDIAVPALVIGGSSDRITQVRGSELLGDSLPKAELKVFPGCGHMSMLERHDEFNGLVRGFLDDVLGAAEPRGRGDR